MCGNPSHPASTVLVCTHGHTAAGLHTQPGPGAHTPPPEAPRKGRPNTRGRFRPKTGPVVAWKNLTWMRAGSSSMHFWWVCRRTGSHPHGPASCQAASTGYSLGANVPALHAPCPAPNSRVLKWGCGRVLGICMGAQIAAEPPPPPCPMFFAYAAPIWPLGSIYHPKNGCGGEPGPTEQPPSARGIPPWHPEMAVFAGQARQALGDVRLVLGIKPQFGPKWPRKPPQTPRKAASGLPGSHRRGSFMPNAA